MRDVPLLSGAELLGHTQEFSNQPLSLMQRFNRELGDMGRLRFGSSSLLVVNTPDLANELLVKRHSHFRKSRALRAGFYPLMGDGLFTSEAGLWRRQRKLMAPIFHPGHVADFDACMTECAALRAGAWADGQTLDAVHEMTTIAMNVASRALFGADTHEAVELGAALTVGMAWAVNLMSSMPFALQIELADWLERAASRLPPAQRSTVERIVGRVERPILWPAAANRRMRAAVRVLDDYVARLLAERRAAGSQPREDLLSRLLHAHEGVDDAAMSDRQLRDEILTLFVAGHETTSTVLAWSLYLLSRHPEVRDALEHEADSLGHGFPTVADLPRLPLATRVFKEALRMYPPIPVYERQAREPVEVGGARLDVGDYAAVFPWALHRRECLWPQPSRFDPDRFLPEAETARHRYAWLPFGAGPRVCIGNHFALQEGPIILATIVGRARLELVGTAEIEPDPSTATQRPRGGLPMRVQLRHP
ncbi:cytochrome P450 [Paraliomyxa miuraensis]|uniref:cytochrome P450 n=1 Tax=Paraliomyxa miuraensis TaxID=376150 RepID=UPI002254A64C|nr:cytochrome P450 [Paraliomyxa miuraensis]MCX4240047.1 cytochrome P450 [Paraliomyxa miuraensis]